MVDELVVVVVLVVVLVLRNVFCKVRVKASISLRFSRMRPIPKTSSTKVRMRRSRGACLWSPVPGLHLKIDTRHPFWSGVYGSKGKQLPVCCQLTHRNMRSIYKFIPHKTSFPSYGRPRVVAKELSPRPKNTGFLSCFLDL